MTSTVQELAFVERAIGQLVVTFTMLQTLLPRAFVHATIRELAHSPTIILSQYKRIDKLQLTRTTTHYISLSLSLSLSFSLLDTH
jgi:hypothetical protein